MTGPDRLELLLNTAQNKVVGLDFVYVDSFQTTLDVYFLPPEKQRASVLLSNPALQADQVHIYCPAEGKNVPEVKVSGMNWIVVDNRDVLRITVAKPGGFALYRLWIDDSRIDPYFVDAAPTEKRHSRGHNDIPFSFKAHCPSDLDCRLCEHECPLETGVDFSVDYRARDFWSFRRALLDFASLRYPDWKDRLEADAGVMLAEVMSALGDELAYYQDRVAREAYLETASQRRSLRRHARLVDYSVHDGLGATTWLDVNASAVGAIPAGTQVSANLDYGEPVKFEVGRGLADAVAKATYGVDPVRNALTPHIWDEDDACLPVGTTELFVNGHHKGNLPLDDKRKGKPDGRWVLLQTSPENRALARRWLVRLIQVDDQKDPLVDDPVTGHDITHLVWEDAQALPFELDLTTLEVHANLVPATAGETQADVYFAIGKTDHPTAKLAVERAGHDGSIAYLFSLPGSDSQPLVWLGEDPRLARPEIRLVEWEFNTLTNLWVEGDEWSWQRTLVGVNSSESDDLHFTLDDGTWAGVVRYQRQGKEILHSDYASGKGVTLRFGDGVFGRIPPRETVFKVSYRLGGGRQANLPADSITQASLGFVTAMTNPLPLTDGLDAETPTEVIKYAPEAFRAETFRAVRPEDYAAAAEKLAWIQRAGAVFRWTGSWLSAFVTPDPRRAASLTGAQRAELRDQMDRYRQAGREVHTFDPQYADLDLKIWICVQPASYRGETEEAVLEALLGKKGVRARAGFFSPDNFTFGTPLNRSALEAAIQAVPGVRAVECMDIRRRGWFDWRPFTELEYRAGMDRVIRLENDPLYPDRGSLKLTMEGGA